MKPADAVRKLREFRERVKHPTDFYAMRQSHWTDTARKLAQQAVLLLRPHDEMAETWALKAQTLASRVSSRLHELPAAGFTLTFSETPAGTAGDPRHYQLDGVKVSDLMRFVEEGRQGNPLGKKLDERDLTPDKNGNTRTNAQIAWRMMYAIRNQSHGVDRLVAAVNKMLGGTINDEGASQIAGSILDHWREALVPMVQADWTEWFARRARAL